MSPQKVSNPCPGVLREDAHPRIPGPRGLHRPPGIVRGGFAAVTGPLIKTGTCSDRPEQEYAGLLSGEQAGGWRVLAIY